MVQEVLPVVPYRQLVFTIPRRLRKFFLFDRSLDGSFFAMEDLDFSGLEAVFRQRVFGSMLRRGKITDEVAEGMRAWPHSGFQVNFQRRLEPEDRKGRESAPPSRTTSSRRSSVLGASGPRRGHERATHAAHHPAIR